MSNKRTPKSLKEARLLRGLTSEQLAALCNVSRPAVSQWENRRQNPDGPSRMVLALQLNFPLPVVESWFANEPAALAAAAQGSR